MAAPIFGSLINSLNIYVDTSRDLDGPGDDVNIQLAENSIAVQSGSASHSSLQSERVCTFWNWAKVAVEGFFPFEFLQQPAPTNSKVGVAAAIDEATNTKTTAMVEDILVCVSVSVYGVGAVCV